MNKQQTQTIVSILLGAVLAVAAVLGWVIDPVEIVLPEAGVEIKAVERGSLLCATEDGNCVEAWNGTDIKMYSDEGSSVTWQVEGSTGDMTFGGTTPLLTIGDGGAEDAGIVWDGNADDFYLALDDSADDLILGYGSTIGTDARLTLQDHLTTTTFLVGDGAEGDMTFVWDGNADDFYIALDDSADDFMIGYGSTVGTDARLTIQDHLTTTTVLVGDAQEADMQIVWDGNAQDFHIGLDDSADDLVVGVGTTLGTSTTFSIDENQVLTWVGGQINLTEAASAADTITANECGKTFFMSGDDYTLTLPAVSTVSAGCEFRFIVAGAPTTSTVVLTGNTDEDVLVGGINELEVDTNDDGPYDADADTITFVGGTAVVGDFVYLISDGSYFYVSGQANADGGITITDSD
jgi:hypothetical protein